MLVFGGGATAEMPPWCLCFNFWKSQMNSGSRDEGLGLRLDVWLLSFTTKMSLCAFVPPHQQSPSYFGERIMWRGALTAFLQGVGEGRGCCAGI